MLCLLVSYIFKNTRKITFEIVNLGMKNLKIAILLLAILLVISQYQIYSINKKMKRFDRRIDINNEAIFEHKEEFDDLFERPGIQFEVRKISNNGFCY